MAISFSFIEYVVTNMAEQRKRKILITHLGGTIGMARDKGTGTLRPPETTEEFEESVQNIISVFNKKYPDVEVEFACLSTEDSNDINPELLEEAIAYTGQPPFFNPVVSS